MIVALKLFAASLLTGWFALVLVASFFNLHPFDALAMLAGP